MFPTSIRFEVLSRKERTTADVDRFFGHCNVVTYIIEENVETSSCGEYKRFVVHTEANRSAGFMRDAADANNGSRVQYDGMDWFIK